jgi:methyltransferase (TIGR00027 family)
MLNDRPSQTAYRVALSRAAHQLLDHPLVLNDPVALAIIGPQGRQEINTHRARFQEPLARHLRAFLIARSCWAEEGLAAAVGRGVGQYVILGAGLDTFAYRNPYPAHALRVFEIDHPATQAWKRQLLAAAALAVPPTVAYVPVDFLQDDLGERLSAAGLRPDAPVFFSWLGVTMYLEPEAVMSTLWYVCRNVPGTEIVFDYAARTPESSAASRSGTELLMQRAAASGEPWRSFFDPPALSGKLKALGFSACADLGATQINEQFFRARGDALRVGGVGRLMSARV